MNINIANSGPGCACLNGNYTSTADASCNWTLMVNSICGGGVIDWVISCFLGSYNVAQNPDSTCSIVVNSSSFTCTANPADFTLVINATISGCCAGDITMTITPIAC